MDTNTYKIVVDKSPRGYACIKSIFNEQGDVIDYCIIDINPSFVQLTKKPEADLLNRSLRDVFLSKNPSHWMNKIIELMKQGGSTEEVRISDEAEGIFLSAHVSKADEVHYIVLLNDLTDLMQKVKESESKYRLIIDYMSDFVWVLSLEREIQYISPSIERILGYAPEEIIDLQLSDFTTPESTEYGLSILAEIQSQNSSADERWFGLSNSNISEKTAKKWFWNIPFNFRLTLWVGRWPLSASVGILPKRNGFCRC